MKTRQKATKAHWASAISGATSAAAMLAMHAFGVIELSPDALTAAAQSVGTGVSIGIVTWLGTYRSPANRAKPAKTAGA